MRLRVSGIKWSFVNPQQSTSSIIVSPLPLPLRRAQRVTRRFPRSQMMRLTISLSKITSVGSTIFFLPMRYKINIRKTTFLFYFNSLRHSSYQVKWPHAFQGNFTLVGKKSAKSTDDLFFLQQALVDFILPQTKYPVTPVQLRFFLELQRKDRRPLDPRSIIDALAQFGQCFPRRTSPSLPFFLYRWCISLRHSNTRVRHLSESQRLRRYLRLRLWNKS